MLIVIAMIKGGIRVGRLEDLGKYLGEDGTCYYILMKE